jgi:hypothetical protein
MTTQRTAEPTKSEYMVYLPENDETIRWFARNLATLEEDLFEPILDKPGVREAIIEKFGTLEDRQEIVAEQEISIQVISNADLDQLDALHASMNMAVGNLTDTGTAATMDFLNAMYPIIRAFIALSR